MMLRTRQVLFPPNGKFCKTAEFEFTKTRQRTDIYLKNTCLELLLKSFTQIYEHVHLYFPERMSALISCVILIICRSKQQCDYGFASSFFCYWSYQLNLSIATNLIKVLICFPL